MARDAGERFGQPELPFLVTQLTSFGDAPRAPGNLTEQLKAALGRERLHRYGADGKIHAPGGDDEGAARPACPARPSRPCHWRP